MMSINPSRLPAGPHLGRSLIIPLLALILGARVAGATDELPADAPSPVGYPTVAAALIALRARNDVTFVEQGGWTIANDERNRTIWSFAPIDNPAYPSVVKRTLVQTDLGFNLDMTVLCEARKPACDKLVADFKALNEQARQSLK